MIRAVIFDLDGTLVRTERLKAISYGRAADELKPSVDHELPALSAFDFIATDDAGHNRPEPEIDLLVARELGATPAECIVIEDSPSGVRSALAAGTRCMGVLDSRKVDHPPTPVLSSRVHVPECLRRRRPSEFTATSARHDESQSGQ